MTDTSPTVRWSSVRGYVLKAIIASVVFAAAIAIIAIVVGSFGILEGKLLTIVLLFIFFALGCLFDAAVVSPRNEVFAFVGIFVNAYLLIAGVVKIALAGLLPNDPPSDSAAIFTAFWVWVWLVVIARLAVGYAMLVVAERKIYRYPSLEPLIAGTLGVLALLALCISLPSLITAVTFPDYFWRLTAVFAVLTVLGTILIPLVGRFFGERLPQPSVAAAQFDGPAPARRLRWPELEDGTPLPALEDGSPDYSVVRPADEGHQV